MNELEKVLELVNSFENNDSFFRGVSGLEYNVDGSPAAIVRYNYSEKKWEAVEV